MLLGVVAPCVVWHRVFHAEAGTTRLVFLTSTKRTNRVFDAGADRFVRAVDLNRVVDASGRHW